MKRNMYKYLQNRKRRYSAVVCNRDESSTDGAVFQKFVIIKDIEMGIKSVDSRFIAYKVLESVQLNLGCLKTLQLSQNQNSIEDINSSYRRLCLLLHPDKHNGDTVYLEAFKAVNLAHKEALTTMSQVEPHRLSDEQPTNPKPAAGHSKWTPFTHAMAPPQQQNHQQPPKATDASAVPTANKWADKSREVKARLLQESAVVNIQEGSSNAALVNKATNKKQSEKKSRFLTARGPSNRRKRKGRRATGMTTTTTTTRAATEANGGGLVSTINSVRKNNNNNIYNNNILVPHSTIGTSSKWIKPTSNLEYTNTTADVENIEEEEEEDVMTEDSTGDYDSEIETDDNEEDSVSWDDNCSEEEDDDGGDGGGISSGVRKKKSKSDGDDEKKEAEAREEKMTVELFLRPPSFGSRGGDRQTRLGISTKKGLCSL